jgi:hypothetical protein
MMKQREKNADATDTSLDIEYIKCCREIEQLQAEFDSTNERKRKIQLVSDQLGGWIYRCAVKFRLQQEEGGAIPKDDRLMSELFEELSTVVGKNLEEIKT